MLLIKLKDIRKVLCDESRLEAEEISELLGSVPVVDAAPVVHGRWEESTDDWFGTTVYTCSKCREDYVLAEGTPKQKLWNYCPNCGAKMDEKEAVYD